MAKLCGRRTMSGPTCDLPDCHNGRHNDLAGDLYAERDALISLVEQMKQCWYDHDEGVDYCRGCRTAKDCGHDGGYIGCAVDLQERLLKRELDSARIFHTGDPRAPVIYKDRDGKHHLTRVAIRHED